MPSAIRPHTRSRHVCHANDHHRPQGPVAIICVQQKVILMNESNESPQNPLVSFGAGGGLGGLLGVLMANLHDHAVLWAVVILVSEAMVLMAFIVWIKRSGERHRCDLCKRSRQRNQ